MANTHNLPEKDRLDISTRLIHLGLTITGVAAWLSGYWAEDYKHLHHPGFEIHSLIGISLAFFVALRLGYGIGGPEEVRFTRWVPYTKDRLLLVWEDVVNLLRLKLPERPPRQGLAAVVETFGLMVFGWMAVTGSSMFLFLEPGRKVSGLLHLIKEGHEMGETLIPVFLGIHGGAVLVHALFGDHLWRRTFFLGK